MELALAPALAAAGSSIQQRPNRVTQRAVPAFLNKLYRYAFRSQLGGQDRKFGDGRTLPGTDP